PDDAGSGVAVGVGSGVAVGVGSGVAVGVGTGVAAGIGTGVGTGVAAGIGTDVGTGAGDGRGDGCRDGRPRVNAASLGCGVGVPGAPPLATVGRFGSNIAVAIVGPDTKLRVSVRLDPRSAGALTVCSSTDAVGHPTADLSEVTGIRVSGGTPAPITAILEPAAAPVDVSAGLGPVATAGASGIARATMPAIMMSVVRMSRTRRRAGGLDCAAS
ncbi:MAG: hypothetical protein ACHQNA_14470, partial [Acidimicrobiales bacterium]